MKKSKIFLTFLYIILFAVSIVGTLHSLSNDRIVLGFISLTVVCITGTGAFINIYEKMLRDGGIIE